MTASERPGTADRSAFGAAFSEPLGITRRGLLQAGVAGAGGLALAPLLGQLEAFAAPSLGRHDGILVLVTLAGGNDGLNTLCPVGDGRYYDLRGPLAIRRGDALMLKRGFGLHPSLRHLKRRYDAGRVAIVRGVGYNPPDLSHFSSMEHWMQGWGGSRRGYPTGWIGRWLDGLPNATREPLRAVTIGTSVPMHLVGRVARASGLPSDISGAFGTTVTEPSDSRMYDAVKSFGRGATGLGRWGDSVGATDRTFMGLTRKIDRAYAGRFPEDQFARHMTLCARLINAGLGIRVLNASLDGFDTHTGQPGTHRALLSALDSGIERFFRTVSSDWKRRVVIVVCSEFGRRPEANDGAGTDHGTANVSLVIGDRVRGGLHGRQPGLAPGALDRYGNLRSHVDFRSVYATVLGRWLHADATEILGRRYEKLDLFASTP